MMSGGAISGNSAFSYSIYGVGYSGVYVGSGGGVYVGSGTFTMNGGTVSGNMVSGNDANGSGVFVSGGTFTMSDGAISSNTASSSGGGVRVADGTFWLRGGTVYGRGAGTGLANTATFGASLSIQDTAAIAKYGSGGDIIESGLATDATLTGHD
jgi:hypothetical protein